MKRINSINHIHQYIAGLDKVAYSLILILILMNRSKRVHDASVALGGLFPYSWQLVRVRSRVLYPCFHALDYLFRSLFDYKRKIRSIFIAYNTLVILVRLRSADAFKSELRVHNRTESPSVKQYKANRVLLLVFLYLFEHVISVNPENLVNMHEIALNPINIATIRLLIAIYVLS